MLFYQFPLWNTQVVFDCGTQHIPIPQFPRWNSAYKRESCRDLPYMNKMFNLFIAIFPNKNMFLYIFSYSTSNVQSIETQQPLPIPQCLSVVARTNESEVGFLTYLNEIFNLCNVPFRTNVCSSICFLLARQKCSRLRHSNSSPFPQCLSVVARTNESQVGFCHI